MALHARVGEVTERLAARSRASRAAYLARIDAAVAGAAAQEARLRQSRPWLRGLRARRQGGAAGGRGAEPRHRHRLQRHAVGASALRDLSRPDQARGARGRRHGAGRRRRAGDVRRRHPGRSGHGALAVLARRDRAVHRRGAVAPDVRRGGLSRRLRQDRAGAADRRAVLRPSAGGLRAGRADDRRACPTTRSRRSASSTPRARSAARSCWRRSRSPTTGPAPAPSTARPTPTRC